MVLKTLVYLSFNHPTWLLARENSVGFSRCESIKFQKVRLRQSLGLKGWQASTELGLLQGGSLYLMSTERSANFSIQSGGVKYHHKIIVENLQVKIMT